MKKTITRRKTGFSPSSEQDKRKVKEWILNCVKRNPGISPLQISESIGIPCTTRGGKGMQVSSIVAVCIKELRNEGVIKHIQGDRRGYYLSDHKESIKLSPEESKELQMKGVTTYYVPVAQLLSALDHGMDVGKLPKSETPLSQPIAVKGKGRGLAQFQAKTIN